MELASILVFFACCLIQVKSFQSDELVEIAIQRIHEDLTFQDNKEFNKGKSGHGCVFYQKHHKKVTEISRQMDLRNAAMEIAFEVFTKSGVSSNESLPIINAFLDNHFQKRQKRQSQRKTRVTCTEENSILQCSTKERYRSADGSCNNLDNPRWGSSNIAMKRYLFTAYSDFLGKPRGENQDSLNEITGFDARRNLKPGCFKPDNAKLLPNPRRISTRFHSTSGSNDFDSASLTHMVTQFGQFLDHDLTFTPESSLSEHCCQNAFNKECFNIAVPSGDSLGSSCLDFGRSTAFCLNPDAAREQMNTLTSFVDASHTYGSTQEESDGLRQFQDGLLKISFQGRSAREMLPEAEETEEGRVFMTGDVRGTEMPGLACLHTLFIREHNRIARMLGILSKGVYSDEELFQRARRLVIGQWQNIVYTEYLPLILGEREIRRHNLHLTGRSRYNPSVDPSIRNSFATAAYRFGHSQIQGLIHMISESENSTYLLSKHFFKMDKYLENDGKGLEMILKGLTVQSAAVRDRKVTREVTEHLFPGLDLVARNIQRGRDHGLPGYNEFRQFCGMPRICSWAKRPREISEESWSLLSSLYEHPNDIDLYSAGVAETNYSGVLGRTFSCIVARQFKALKDGDRFFVTHDETEVGFGDAQLEAIRKRTLRDLICENTAIVELQQDVFRKLQQNLDCRITNKLDLTLFV